MLAPLEITVLASTAMESFSWAKSRELLLMFAARMLPAEMLVPVIVPVEISVPKIVPFKILVELMTPVPTNWLVKVRVETEAESKFTFPLKDKVLAPVEITVLASTLMESLN